MNNQRRMPRPKGITNLTIDNKQYAIDKIIQMWIIGGFRLNQKSVDIDTIATMLHKNRKWVMLKILKESNNTIRLFGDGNAAKLGTNLGVLAINWSLEDRGLIQNQVAGLIQAQGPTGYKPFISSTLNAALGMLPQSTKTLLEIAKLFKVPNPANTPAVVINNTQSQAQNSNYLTVTKAVEMLSEQPKLDISELPISEEILALPEVRATHQAMVKTDMLSTKEEKRIQALKEE